MKYHWLLGATLVGLALCVGCQKEIVGTQGEALQEEKAPVAVTLEGYSLERVEVEGDAGPLVYSKPVLAMKLKFENTGSDPFFYQPTHGADKVSNQQAPLLFVDPGPKGELTQNIPGVFLEKGFLTAQQTGGTQIEPGASLSDVYVFSPPDGDNMEMMLTVPASMHGGKQRLKIKVSYTKPALPPVKINAPGEAISFGDASLTIKGAKVEFVRLKDSSLKAEGFSKDPVLKVSYEIENKGDAPLAYDPNHKGAGSILAPSLRDAGGSGNYMRVRFGADRDVKGQKSGNLTLAKGEKVNDFALFERPPESVKNLRFMIPGKVFGQKGVARVDIPYTYANPAKPAELTPAATKEEK